MMHPQRKLYTASTLMAFTLVGLVMLVVFFPVGLAILGATAFLGFGVFRQVQDAKPSDAERVAQHRHDMLDFQAKGSQHR